MTVGSLLLSYIDVQDQGFFPSRLTVGEARDLGSHLIRVGSLVPVRDELADTVFQGRALHMPVEEQRAKVLATEQAKAESVDSSSAKAMDTKDEMVVRRNMMANWFLPDGCLTV